MLKMWARGMDAGKCGSAIVVQFAAFVLSNRQLPRLLTVKIFLAKNDKQRLHKALFFYTVDPVPAT
jgi:hypothetical protein